MTNPPPPTIPLLNIRSRFNGQRMTELAIEAMAYYGAPYQPGARRVAEPDPAIGPDYAILAMPLYLMQRAATIAGGTPDIQRNNLTKSLLRI